MKLLDLTTIRKLNPVDRLIYWITERESIRLKKESGEEKPWTKDPILQSYRFCNVRRMDDKVSHWLYENWYSPYYNHQNMLLAVCLARFINKPESLELVGFPDGNWIDYKKEAKYTLRQIQKHRPVFNGAYMVRGNDGVDKISSVFDYYIKSIEDRLAKSERIIEPASMETTWSRIYSSYGFGSFMAGQVVADLRHAVKGSWKDKQLWAPVGPGSQRGMNRLRNMPITKSISQETFNRNLLELRFRCNEKIPSYLVTRLEAHDWQNCLCEFDKYERALWEEGKPKQKYEGV